MEKRIYLLDENYNWKEFSYNEISDLKEELEKRKITIGNSATIGDYATIGYYATIGNYAKIGDYATIGFSAKIGNSATIGNSAKIGNSAIIGNFATIGDYATIGYYATIGNYAKIGDYATIGFSATIGDKISIIKGFYIFTKKHSITYVGDNKLSIGCRCLKISNWKKNYKEIGRIEGYTDEEIEEYGNYIKMAELFIKTL